MFGTMLVLRFIYRNMAFFITKEGKRFQNKHSKYGGG
jgi:hypothetical protein